MMQRAKFLCFFLLWVVLQACTGGSACSGCVEPIPGGFPLDRRVANAGQMRLTPNAFTFLEANASTLVETLIPGGLTFPIDECVASLPTRDGNRRGRPHAVPRQRPSRERIQSATSAAPSGSEVERDVTR